MHGVSLHGLEPIERTVHNTHDWQRRRKPAGKPLKLRHVEAFLARIEQEMPPKGPDPGMLPALCSE
jgi:hypothetical protein